MSRHTSDTKMNRKRAKYSSILHKLYQMSAYSEPSQNLMICNAGLSLGVNREDLLLFFSNYGKIQTINMVSKESHSFIKFHRLEDAEKCFYECNGKLAFPCMKGPLYLLYLESLPVITMNEVFKEPPGCVLIQNFVTETEEEVLKECVKDSLTEGGDLKHRKVSHFGYEFKYGENNIDKNNPLSRGVPPECDFVKDRLAENGYDLQWQPNQLTVNHYFPGQGIPPHIDTHSAFEDPILSLSLSSGTVMEFRRDEKHWSVVLPRRSMLVMSGECRYAWTHCITSRKSDIKVDESGCLFTEDRKIRLSFTFRRIRLTPCNCTFPQFCDSQQSHKVVNDTPPPNIEEEYVHKVYENISSHFSRTRHKPWPLVLDLVKTLEPGSILLDVGCGNCKYFGFSSQTYEIGSDHSFGLLSISRQRGFQAVRSNCLSLPFRNDSVDCVLCIAVIHHLSSDLRRITSIKEILRVLRDNGKALIYVWAKDQKHQGKASSYLKYQTQPVTNPKDVQETCKELPIHINRTNFSEGQNDVFVPWKLKTESSSEPSSTHLRYYHVFDKGELEALCVEAGGNIMNNYYDNGNWCCLINKKLSTRS